MIQKGNTPNRTIWHKQSILRYSRDSIGATLWWVTGQFVADNSSQDILSSCVRRIHMIPWKIPSFLP